MGEKDNEIRGFPTRCPRTPWAHQEEAPTSTGGCAERAPRGQRAEEPGVLALD